MKLSKAHKGKPTWNKGKKLSEKTRKKLSESHKGKPTWLSTHHLSKESIAKMSASLKGRTVWNEKKVCQYTLDGELIAEYRSASDAFRKTKIYNILGCCRGERSQACGYIWRKKNG